ncbi:MAG: PIN domain-containing protein [Rhodospirillales bacterium]|nr:PIN domain-containing protein [Rhodospirillales bacterium]
MPFVLDTSVSLAWCFHDEATRATWAMLDRLIEDSAIVPSLWHLETSNVLVAAERRGRITARAIAEYIGLLGELPIEVDDSTPMRALGGILQCARDRGLTAYDAAYLELAARRGLPLATRDKLLSRAAQDGGVRLVPD